MDDDDDDDAWLSVWVIVCLAAMSRSCILPVIRSQICMGFHLIFWSATPCYSITLHLYCVICRILAENQNETTDNPPLSAAAANNTTDSDELHPPVHPDQVQNPPGTSEVLNNPDISDSAASDSALTLVHWMRVHCSSLKHGKSHMSGLIAISQVQCIAVHANIVQLTVHLLVDVDKR